MRAGSMEGAIEAAITTGWSVFPLSPGSKIPIKGSSGFRDATTSKAAILKAFRDNPGMNLGWATGGSYFVLDIDPAKEGRPAGADSLEWLQERYGELPPTRTHLTPRGGRHLVFRKPSSLHVPSRSNVGSDETTFWGIDVRGEGGYVVLPPSEIDGVPYMVEDEDDPPPIADAPGWLLKLVGRRHNIGGKVFIGRCEEIPAEEYDILADALTYLSSEDYHQWVEVGLALHRLADHQAAYDIWHGWSETASTYGGPEATFKKWNELTDPQSGQVPITYRTIYERAQAQGWVNPGAADTDFDLEGLLEDSAPVAPPSGGWRNFPTELLPAGGFLRYWVEDTSCATPARTGARSSPSPRGLRSWVRWPASGSAWLGF